MNQLAPVSKERLSWAEMCRRYPDQWLLVEEPEGTEGKDLTGIVIDSSRTHGGIWRSPHRGRLGEDNIVFTGEYLGPVGLCRVIE